MDQGGLDDDLRWLELALSEEGDAEPHRARLAAIRRDLSLVGQLPEGPEMPLEAFIPEAPASAPPLPAALLAQLEAIPGAEAGGWWARLTGALRGPWILGLAAAGALLALGLPLRDTGLVKGPRGDELAMVQGPPVTLHLVAHADDGRVERLKMGPLAGGGHGLVAPMGDAVLPVFLSPDLDLSKRPWHLYAFLGGAGSAITLSTGGAAAPLDALPDTAHLYASPIPLRLGAAPTEAPQRLVVVLSADPLGPEAVEAARSRLEATGAEGPRTRLLPGASGAVIETSVRVEVR